MCTCSLQISTYSGQIRFFAYKYSHVPAVLIIRKSVCKLSLCCPNFIECIFLHSSFRKNQREYRTQGLVRSTILFGMLQQFCEDHCILGDRRHSTVSTVAGRICLKDRVSHTRLGLNFNSVR